MDNDLISRLLAAAGPAATQPAVTPANRLLEQLASELDAETPAGRRYVLATFAAATVAAMGAGMAPKSAVAWAERETVDHLDDIREAADGLG